MPQDQTPPSPPRQPIIASKPAVKHRPGHGERNYDRGNIARHVLQAGPKEPQS